MITLLFCVFLQFLTLDIELLNYYLKTPLWVNVILNTEKVNTNLVNKSFWRFFLYFLFITIVFFYSTLLISFKRPYIYIFCGHSKQLTPNLPRNMKDRPVTINIKVVWCIPKSSWYPKNITYKRISRKRFRSFLNI